MTNLCFHSAIEFLVLVLRWNMFCVISKHNIYSWFQMVWEYLFYALFEYSVAIICMFLSNECFIWSQTSLRLPWKLSHHFNRKQRYCSFQEATSNAKDVKNNVWFRVYLDFGRIYLDPRPLYLYQRVAYTNSQSCLRMNSSKGLFSRSAPLLVASTLKKSIWTGWG